MPNPQLFPVTGVTVDLQDGSQLRLDPELVKLALQYSPTPGLPALVEWLAQLQHTVHGRARDGYGVMVTTGSQDGLSMPQAFQMLIDRGDHILVETPTYSGSLAALRPLGCHMHAIATDGDGMIPASLQQVLETWPAGQPRPKFIYTIPNGSNPSGGSLTAERKRAIYALARAHNLLILEDDAYYFLQFGTERAPSLFSMDTDGRVLRFDSFSKIVSSGLRLGFVTGPKPLVDQIGLHGQASFLHASGLSQALLLSLVQNWGIAGFHAHTAKVADFYRQRRDVFQQAAAKHLTGLAEWTVPSAGMFFWIKLLGTTDSMALIKNKAVERKFLMVPGQAFMPDDAPTPYVRASFSLASEADIHTALERLASLLREMRA